MTRKPCAVQYIKLIVCSPGYRRFVFLVFFALAIFAPICGQNGGLYFELYKLLLNQSGIPNFCLLNEIFHIIGKLGVECLRNNQHQ